jgi:hypothetical protein
MVRYYANVLHLDPLWFVPDMVAFVCILLFVYRAVVKDRSAVAGMLCLYMIFSIYLSYIFLGEVKGVASSIKMIIPIFVGFCFAGRRLESYPGLLFLCRALFYVSVIGIVASARIKFPWVGFAYEEFGADRTAGRLWWSGAEERLAGFAADNTMAGYFVLITYVITSVRKSILWCLVFGALGLFALKLTTSKTSMVDMAVYIVLLIGVRLAPDALKMTVLRKITLSSFAALLIPVLLIVLLAGFDLTRISPSLFSLQDRINNSWQLPFVYMWTLMPIGYLTGCGIGCFNYPQQLFSQYSEYYVPVDNFYLGTYLMFGPLFALFVLRVFLSYRGSTDIYRMSLMVATNLFTITVLSYGPASGLMVVAICFSEVFVRQRQQAPRPGVLRSTTRPVGAGLTIEGAGR